MHRAASEQGRDGGEGARSAPATRQPGSDPTPPSLRQRLTPRGSSVDSDRTERQEPVPAPEPRQRWRITFARDVIASDRVGRSLLDDWHRALLGSGLPVALQDTEANRPRVAFGAPLPASARGEAELADLWLVERVPLWRIRESLSDRLPPGHRWVAAEDIWLGAPPLPGQVSGAEWRVELRSVGGSRAVLADAARALASSTSLLRARQKGGVSRTYDLRPLFTELAVEPGEDDALRIVTRFDAALGTGRPEEIVAALGEEAGVTIEIGSLIRKRLILNETAVPTKAPRSPRAAPLRRTRG